MEEIISFGSSALMSSRSRMLSLGKNVAIPVFRMFLLSTLRISLVVIP